jgi:hypothetical protein
MDFSPEALRKEWRALTAKREKIDAVLQPARDELNTLVAGDTKLSFAKARDREADLRETIRKQQDKLGPIEMQRAAVARALGGKTGE